MSQQKLNFLLLSATYESVELALVNDLVIHAAFSLDKKIASKTLTLTLDQLLRDNQSSLSQLSFIAVNQGPAPFTTLRTVIATANGLSFATQLPLVGVDGFDALLQEVPQSGTIHIALLNAFAYDVYYAIQDTHEITKGCAKVADLLALLHQKYAGKKLIFFGGGALLYSDVIKENFKESATILSTPLFASLNMLVQQARKEWEKQNTHAQLMPIYLKRAS
jgi:tRNA threonylcarbamoyl adenosine modification protein YeaZ